MTKKSKQLFIWSVVGLINIMWGIFFLISANSKPGKLDTFAQCLKEKDSTFYGAFWCPHCQNQKAMFGKSQNCFLMLNVQRQTARVSLLFAKKKDKWLSNMGIC